MHAHFLRTIGLSAAPLLLATPALSQTWTDFQVDGETRQALVYVPEGIDQPPLLISLHGRGIPAGWNQGEMMKFEPIADREKFIVVYPEAENNLNWDLGGSYDIDFVLQIIEDMDAQYDIDTDRVYASGFSMGGMFSYTLACKIPDAIAAIAPGNGYPLGGVSGCVQSRSVPIFHMHGTADDFVAYSGIHNFLDGRIAEYGCPTEPTLTDPYPVGSADSKSFKETWGPCTNNQGHQSEVVLVSVAGMIHDWATAGKANTNEDPEFNGKPFDIDGSEEAWAFLKKHSLTGTIPDDDDLGTGGDGNATGGASNGSGGEDSTTGGDGGSASNAAGGALDGGTGGFADDDRADEGGDLDAGCSYGASTPSRSGTTGALALMAGLALVMSRRVRREKHA